MSKLITVNRLKYSDIVPTLFLKPVRRFSKYVSQWGTVLTATLAVFVAVSIAHTSAASDGELFDIYEIDTGSAQHQTVLTGSFTEPDSVELAVFSIDDDDTRSVKVFRLNEGNWQSIREWPVSRDILFVDRLTRTGRNHVLTYRIGGFGRFDLESGFEEVLVDVLADFQRDPGSGLPRLHVARDLNGDGLDDIVMPSKEGFWISTQLGDGTYSEAVRIGSKEPHLNANAYGDERTYGEVGINAQTLPWYLSRVHQLDYDRDGRRDLVFWNDPSFEVYRQDASGQFVDDPESFTVDVPFDFDGAYALAFQFSDRGVASLLLGLGGRFEYTIFQGFPDLNQDGIGDLVTLTFSGRRIFSLRGRYDVHFGKETPQGIGFSKSPDTSAWTPGPAGGEAFGYASQRYVDIDADGMNDLTMASVNTGLGGMTRAMVGNSISMDVAVYRLEDGAYPEQPDIRRKIRTPFAPFDKRGVLFPTILSGDVNGDGRMDLLAVERWDELSVYLGINSPQLLSKKSYDVAVEVPVDERFVKVGDLNHDGHDDLVIQYPSESETNRVAVLLAR